MLAALALTLLLQQQTGFTSPASGDTAGYWQQRADYVIAATLDERAQALRATATLTYANHSPDTLRELYLHQYLNAFRPGSRWSADDAREGRVRFQSLREPDYGYERFTAAPTVDGTPVRVEYPGAPDSTVARLALPRPLAPGGTIVVRMAWEARPSTVTRRQGRRARHWDFAQWYPKVAVYDRGGWQHNALRPAGEFYGEFGSFDVSLTLAGDQVVAATGIPVSGDPGWERVKRWGEVHLMRDAYGDSAAAASDAAGAAAPDGMRTVRWRARDIHHFAWSTSPDYLYEGGLVDGRVAIHVLYRPGDEPQWGNGAAVRRTETALRWLESIYGRYAYPQVTNLHRLDPGGTEFPMMMMNGSASQGLILHEGGHIYSYGILASNEWRAGWMDEGLTSYQTSWATGATPQELARGVVPIGGASPRVLLEPPRRTGYAARALRPAVGQYGDIGQIRLDLTGRAQPIGTVAHEFSEFAIYNEMIYSRGEWMYSALRDVVGDSAFARFLRTYYDRWKLKHVDERAMRRAAEDACGCELGWFFAQWVHRTGLVDYALRAVDTRRDGDGWLTRVRVVRRGEYRHAAPVGVRTDTSWTIVHADPARDDQWVELRTAAEPDEVRLDPLRTSPDWDRRNDVRRSFLGNARHTLDWPFLDQSLGDREVVAWLPMAWYSSPGGLTGGVRSRSNYLGFVDRSESGIVVSAKVPDGADDWSRLGAWVVVDNPRIGARPVIGGRMGLWALDGLLKAEVGKTWDVSPFLYARGPRLTHALALTFTTDRDGDWTDTARWTPESRALDAAWEGRWRAPSAWSPAVRVRALGGVAWATGAPIVVDDMILPGERKARGFGRGELEATVQRRFRADRRLLLGARLFAGAQSDDAPLQRSLGLVSRDATDAFGNHLLRGRGALLARDDAHFADLGGAGLRGYSPLLRARSVAALNLEAGVVAWRPPQGRRLPEVHLVAFGDGARADGAPAEWLADAGVGIALRGPLFDRDVRLRVDLPILVRDPALAVGTPSERDGGRARLRWVWSVRDLW